MLGPNDPGGCWRYQRTGHKFPLLISTTGNIVQLVFKKLKKKYHTKKLVLKVYITRWNTIYLDFSFWFLKQGKNAS